jgi:hypothetical protein
MAGRNWNKDRAQKRIDAKIQAMPLNAIAAFLLRSGVELTSAPRASFAEARLFASF